jgi:hypothetical protein
VDSFWCNFQSQHDQQGQVRSGRSRAQGRNKGRRLRIKAQQKKLTAEPKRRLNVSAEKPIADLPFHHKRPVFALFCSSFFSP